MGNPIGQVVGAFFAAWPMERYGRKKTFGITILFQTRSIVLHRR